MKRIGIIAYADRLSGGVFQYTMSMIDALRHDDRSRFVIITKAGNNQFDHAGIEVRKIEQNGSGLRMLGNALLLLFEIRSPLFCSAPVKKALADIDMFVAPTMSPHPYYFFGKPFVFTLHDLQERYYPRFFTLQDRVRRWLNGRALVRAAGRIITESRFVKADAVNFLGAPEERIAVLPAPPTASFLDKTFAEGELEGVRRKYGLPESYLLYPAQVWYHKNHGRLLDALKLLREKHPDLHLVLTGGEQSGYGLLQAQIRELRLEERVHYLGYVDYADLPAIYRLSRMLVMPSLFESISIPVYEAFSLRVPVVCSNVVALPEQVQDAGLLFDPHDSAEMAAQVDRLLTDAALAQRLAQRGYELVRGYDHRSYMLELRRIIDSVAG